MTSGPNEDAFEFDLLKNVARAIKSAAKNKSGTIMLNTDALVYAEAAITAVRDSAAA